MSESAKGRSFIKRNRGRARTSGSPLAGKIFDQTGDRLTPSHSKSAKGRRLRYYVSHRLVRGTAPRDPSGWRLPAPELEDKVADLVAAHMNRPDVRAGILNDAITDETFELGCKLTSLATKSPGEEREGRDTFLALVKRIDVAPGELRIAISAECLAELLGVDQARLDEDMLTITSAFQHRKRGVETKLIIGDEPADIDETLLRNIGLANRYFDLVRAGNTFNEIAESEGVSKRRIQQLIELAFLAPDVIRAVRDGRQPVGMTSDWLKQHAFSPVWSDQRNMFAAL